MKNNLQEIRAAFSAQAKRFNEYQKDTFKTAFTQSMVNDLDLNGSEMVLEIAAGTCALGRLIAPHVAHITELDITEEMLSAGRAANLEAGIQNAEYVIGNAETLPFTDASFDVVTTRLSFHHFQNPEIIMREIVRALKPGGKAAILDMVPPDESLRERFDHYETVRDHSHVRCLTLGELTDMMNQCELRVLQTNQEIIPMNLSSWMSLTDPEQSDQEEIRNALMTELTGGEACGMSPYMENGKIMFHRHWMYAIAKKQ